MKRMLFLLSGVLFITGNASAQISLAQSGYTTSPIGTDTLKTTIAASAFPSFAPATNAMWDLTTVTDSTAVLLAYKVASVPPATFADSNTYSLGTYAYKGSVQSAIMPTGLLEYGINITGATYPIGTTAGDTIFIPTQNATFSSTHKVIAFPATMSTSWTSVYESDFNFQLSYVASPLPSYVHAPGLVKAFITEKDSVIGWGKMRIKNAAGTASGYMDVLQVRSMITTVDTFYLNGGTTDLGLSLILSSLGLTQGQVTKTYAQNFYRINDVTPLAYVQFSDSANTTPTKVTTNAQRLAPSGILTVLTGAGVSVYPNPVSPVSGQVLTVILPPTSGAWSYEMVDVTGRKVLEGALQSNGSNAQIALPASMITGMYYLKVNNNGNTVSTTSVEVAK